MTSSAMPCRAALATSAGTIKSIVELLSTASRNGTSGSRDLPLRARFGNGLGQLRQLVQVQARAAPAPAVRAPEGRPNFPQPSACSRNSCGARGSHCNSA